MQMITWTARGKALKNVTNFRDKLQKTERSGLRCVWSLGGLDAISSSISLYKAILVLAN